MTFLVALLASSAFAADPVQPIEHPFGFTEITGGYGMSVGTTPYVPDEGEFHHPLTNGPSVGGAIGLGISQHLLVFGEYAYSEGHSRHGSIEGVLDKTSGTIKYNTLSLGLRSMCGNVNRVFGDLSVGVLFPFHTTTTYEYNEALAPLGISGTGTAVSNYETGYGGTGAMGYQRMIADRLYISGLVKLRLFTTNNNGQKTTYTNFVRDFTALPPVPVNQTVIPSTDVADATPPNTYSVQDARLQISVGAYF